MLLRGKHERGQGREEVEINFLLFPWRLFWRLMWDIFEKKHWSFGRFAPWVFGQIIGRKGRRIK
jgi:hypothetical protein